MNVNRVPAYMELNGHKTEIGIALVDLDMGCAEITVSNHSAIEILGAKSIGNVSVTESIPDYVTAKCVDHKPTQHRDTKPPWCNTCGLTGSYEIPVGRFQRDKEELSSDHEFTD